MAKARNKRGTQSADYILRLFVAGDTPNSRIARENLHRLFGRLDRDEFDVEIVDVTEDAQTALEQRVFVTPALQVIEPGLESVIFGDLSDRDALRTLFPGKVV